MKNKNPPKPGSVLDKEQKQQQQTFGKFRNRGEDFTPLIDDELLEAVFSIPYYFTHAPDKDGLCQILGRPKDGVDRRFRKLATDDYGLHRRRINYCPGPSRLDRTGLPMVQADLRVISLVHGTVGREKGCDAPEYMTKIMMRDVEEVKKIMQRLSGGKGFFKKEPPPWKRLDDTGTEYIINRVEALLIGTLEKVNRLLDNILSRRGE